MREIREPSLSSITTLGLGGTCSLELTVENRDELGAMDDRIRELGLPVYVIGRGSNIFGLDGSHEAVLVRPAISDAPAVMGDADGRVLVSCGAGVPLPGLLSFRKERGLSGMEGLAGIPGTVGGGAAMNAGAYGGQISDNICWADVMDSQGNVLHLTADELELGYRRSIILQNNYIVLRAGFRFQPGDPEKISARVQEISASRREKQPLEYPSAGSTFKRPDGYYSGKLIQDCGLKGYRIGGAEVSTKHSGFVINVDHATADDVVQLIAHIRSEVMRRFNVNIEPEVRFIGEFTGKVDI